MYFGQEVAMKISLIEVDSDIINRPHGYSLLLKPLTAITNEDLSILYSLHNSAIGYDGTMDFRAPLEMAKHWLLHGGEKDMVKIGITADYLRSKGYAIPWLYLSVKDLVEYGWIKLKEQ